MNNARDWIGAILLTIGIMVAALLFLPSPKAEAQRQPVGYATWRVDDPTSTRDYVITRFHDDDNAVTCYILGDIGYPDPLFCVPDVNR